MFIITADQVNSRSNVDLVAARRAVDRAKKRHTKFALEMEPSTLHASEAQSLIDLRLVLRARRRDTNRTSCLAAILLRVKALGQYVSDENVSPATRVLGTLISVSWALISFTVIALGYPSVFRIVER